MEDEIEVKIVDSEEELEEVIHPSLVFEIYDGHLMTRVQWPEDVDFELFAKTLIKILRGEFLNSIMSSIRRFGEVTEDEDFAEHLAFTVNEGVGRPKTSGQPRVKPTAAIPMLSRRGFGGEQ